MQRNSVITSGEPGPGLRGASGRSRWSWLVVGLSGLGLAIGLWASPMIDLQAYRAGAAALIHGRDIYSAHLSGSALPFTYPPFAAIVFSPLAVLDSDQARVAITSLSVLALLGSVYLLVRHIRPSWTPGRAWTITGWICAVAVCLEPIRATFSFGQINLLLMALVLIDVLGRQTRLPRGTLIGLAAAVKLTPGIFVLYLALTGRRKQAGTAAATMVVVSGLGFVLDINGSRAYWTSLVFDPNRMGNVAYIGNQSLRGLVARLGGGPHEGIVIWFLGATAILILGLTLAAYASRRGEDLLGLTLCAIVGLIVSPLSWNHHWVWALPVALTLYFRWTVTRSNWILGFAAAWNVLFLAGPIWWVPNSEGREYGLHGVQILLGNSYLLAAGALLLVTPALLRAKEVTHTVGGVQTSFMPDFSVLATAISTTGTLLGALGGVALTYGVTVRREEAQARRRRKDQRTQARRQAYVDLLGATTQLKVEIEIAGQRYWKDMNVRLATIQEHAVSAGMHASRVALLSPEAGQAARALASAAIQLAAATAEHTNLGSQDEGGQITRPADFREFDDCLTHFSDAAAQDSEE